MISAISSNLSVSVWRLMDVGQPLTCHFPPERPRYLFFWRRLILWLKFEPNYQQEIVITDSNKRHKDIKAIEDDINAAIWEIRRILKDN